jgi:peptidyl-prolyl cis-trans isomerase A (cyclophilin A)
MLNRRKPSNSSQEDHYDGYKDAERKSKSTGAWQAPISLSLLLVIFICLSTMSALYTGFNRSHHHNDHRHNNVRASVNASTYSNELVNDSTHNKHSYKITISGSEKKDSRTIHSLQDLSPAQLHPQATSSRYIVTPPKDDIPITLVTCETTKGFLHIVVHPSWAKLGANRFLRMVNVGYFSKVALMRCLKNFLCQFGIAGDPSYNKEFNVNLKDDPNWLPEGPSHRTNALGVKRFNKGFLAYAGSGKNSRGNQFIVALHENERLGGGSPWEVPWGEVVGDESYATLDKIYTGYGENGPSQGRLSREGSSEEIAKEFPMLDYVLNCEVVDSE